MAAQKKKRPTEVPDKYREGEGKLNPRWQVHFLDELASTSNVSAAARFAGVNTAHVYKLRRLDPEFALCWRASLLEGYEHLELETIRRLRNGVTADDAKFDIPSALRLLAMHKESVAKERARMEHSDEASVLASLTRQLDAIRRNRQAAREALRSNPAQAIVEPGRDK